MRRSLPPLVALLAARLLTAGAALWAGLNPLQTGTWVRWDSGHYLSISQRGYFLEHCTPESGYTAAQWCGNTGWFPLYSWLMRGADGVLLSLFFESAALVLVWRFFLREKDPAALALAAFFPGLIYQQAVFPISLVVFCALAFIAACELERWWLAAAAGAACAMAYTTGLMLAPAAAVWMLLRKRGSLIPLAGIAAGYIAVLIVFQAQAGDWRAPFLVQTKYSYAFMPLDTLFSRLKPLVNARYRNPATFAAASQTLLVLAMMAMAIPRAWRTLPGIYCIAFWTLPIAAGGPVGLYRAEALLVPLAFLAPRRARLPLLAAAIPISFAISVAFFRGAVV